MLVRAAELLPGGRRGLSAYVDWQSPEFAALDYYDDALYQVPGLRRIIAAAMRSGAIDVVILSGAYGTVYADERIHRYQKRQSLKPRGQTVAYIPSRI